MPRSIHTRSIAERMRWLAELGAEHSRNFAGPEAYLQRRYRAEHSTAILAFKCMDGRIHLPYITKTPLGIIQLFRNLGGAFDIGWPHLGELVAHEVMRAVEEGRRILILVTYHYSLGDRSRGCSGFDYDLEAARSSAFAFRRQLESVFGTDHQIVYPLVVGIETDEDALTLHWDRGTAIELAAIESEGRGEAELEDQLARSLPGHAGGHHARRDAARHRQPVAHRGGATHGTLPRHPAPRVDPLRRARLRLPPRPEHRAHRRALLPEHRRADRDTRIIQTNMEMGRIPDDGMILLASSPYDEVGIGYRRAVEKSKFLSRFAAATIRAQVPYIHCRMIRKTCVLNWTDWSFEEIETVYP